MTGVLRHIVAAILAAVFGRGDSRAVDPRPCLRYGR